LFPHLRVWKQSECLGGGRLLLKKKRLGMGSIADSRKAVTQSRGTGLAMPGPFPYKHLQRLNFGTRSEEAP
jgi:hypothetical protein